VTKQTDTHKIRVTTLTVDPQYKISTVHSLLLLVNRVLLFHIREVLGSNLSWENGYLSELFCVFLRPSRQETGDHCEIDHDSYTKNSPQHMT